MNTEKQLLKTEPDGDPVIPRHGLQPGWVGAHLRNLWNLWIRICS